MRESRVAPGLRSAPRRWARAAALVAALGGGCGGVPPAPASAPVPRDSDQGVRVAELLPSHADECMIARPALLPDRRRPLVQRASLGDVLAWSRTPRIVAYASARRHDERGRAERVTVLRLAESYEGRRDELASLLRDRVRWADRPCTADDCDLPRATMIDGRTVRVERGRWAGAEAGASPCVALAIARPSAIQLDARVEAGGRGHCGEGGLDDCVQRRILEPTADGLAQRVETSLGSEEAAARALERLAHVPDVEGGIEIDRRGATVVQIRRFSWEQLELAVEDERIERAALERRSRAQRVRPAADVDVEVLPLVRAQVGVREARMERLSGAGRREAAAELARLLARARVRHPAELDLAQRLVRLQLDELDDPQRAAALVEEVLATTAAPLEAWRALRREARVAQAAARPGDDAALEDAARALVEDGIARDLATGRAAARDLAALRSAGRAVPGVTFELAESAWSQARATSTRATALARVPRGAGAPISSLAAALAWLAELSGDPGPTSVFVVARGVPRSAAGSDGAGPRVLAAERPEDALLLRFDGAARTPLFAGSAASTDAMLRLGALLEAALAPGPIAIDVVLVSLSAPGVDRWLRVEGELGIGRMAIERADGWTARHDWAVVERYLAEPLAMLGTRTFPPPELAVRAASDEEASRLAAIGDDPPQARCEAIGREVRCAPRADSDVRGSLRRIARAALGARGAAPAGR